MPLCVTAAVSRWGPGADGPDWPDVNFAVTCSVFNAFWQDRRYLPSLLQQELALAGRLGKKSGHGVYRWPAEVRTAAALPPVAHGAQSVITISDSVTELDELLLLETEGETARR